MTDRPPHTRAHGIARALAVLMLLAGIVAMHSAVFAPGSAHAHGSSDAAHIPASASAVPDPHTAAPEPAHASGTGCGAAGCDDHAAIHACVFILAALGIALSLVLLYRLGEDATEVRSARTIWRGRRRRPPPWTVLTLSQLVILRI